MFGAGVRCVVVVGAQWGDEGKGKVVDALAERAALVVRYQGGANAGHTVDAPERRVRPPPDPRRHPPSRHALRHRQRRRPRPRDAVPRDRRAGRARRARSTGASLISDRAHLVLPYHKLLDAESPRSREIGTTSRGIGPAYEDKIGRRGRARRATCGTRRSPDALVRAGLRARQRGAPAVGLARSAATPERGDARRSPSWRRASSRSSRTRARWCGRRCGRRRTCCSRARRARCSTWTTAPIRSSRRRARRRAARSSARASARRRCTRSSAC